MVGHRFRKSAAEKKEADREEKEYKIVKAAEINSAQDFISHVGRTSDRLDKGHRKALNLAGAAVAVYMALSPIAFAGQSLHEPAYSKQDIEALDKLMRSDAKYSARGESVEKGSPTNEILGVVNIDKLKGISSEMLNGGRTVNGASVQLNTYVHVISSGGGSRWIWVQNGVQIFIHGNKELQKPSYTYGSISEIFKDSINLDVKIAEGKELTQKDFNKLNLNGMHGKGIITDSAGVIPTYVYSDYKAYKENGRLGIRGGDTRTSDRIRFAIDIRVTEKQDIAYLNFGIIPVNGNTLDWSKEVEFDTVSYKVQGLKSAKIEFGKLKDTGLVIAGIGGGTYFHAKEITGAFTMYEREAGRFVPLAVSGNSDWSTGEHDIGVHSIRLNSYTVELIKAKKESSAGN
jgi:hypothetical protein